MGRCTWIALALVFSWSCAQAQDAPTTKWYVSADVGKAKNGVSSYAYGLPDSPRDEKSEVYRVRAGYQFWRFFAMEGGYADLGNYSNNVRMDCSVSPSVECIPDFRSSVDLKAWTVNAVASYSFGDRLSVRAQLGWMYRTKDTHQVPVTGDDWRRSSSQILPVFGFGASFALQPRLELYGEWNKFVGKKPGYGDGNPSPPGSITDESDVEAFSLGVRWRF